MSGLLGELRRSEAEARGLLEDALSAQRGRAWRLLTRYRAIAARVMPPGGRARRAYERLTRAPSAPVPSEQTISLLREIQFPPATTPVVSIIIPVHGQLPTTAACLVSLASTFTAIPFEIVIVDDASPDGGADALSAVSGVRVVRLATNLGFVGAVNAGIAATESPFVVLLNNDCEVTDGWLDALVDLAQGDERIGVVGAKLVYPDGRLQEAGGVIFDDGSGWNYGRNEHPGSPQFGFVRDVDYASGACLLVRRALLDKTGGLDERYAPAYYEDTDLAFEARARGYRVVYQPAATVIHHEGVSHGTSTGSGVKRFQELNRTVFVEKWGSELAQHHRLGTHITVARSGRPRARVVVVDYQVPKPDQDAGSVRVVAMMTALRELGCAVTLIPDNRAHVDPYVSELQQLGIEVLWGDLDYVAEMRDRQPDLCIVARPEVAVMWVRRVREHAPNAVLLYDTVDLHFVREGRRAVSERSPSATRSAAFYRELELAIARSADAVAVLTDDEAELLRGIEPALDVVVLPMAHSLHPGGPPCAQRHDLLFVGGYHHPPNVDAVLFLAEEIMPRLADRLPGVRVLLAGSHPPPEVQGLASASVDVLGWVADLEPLYRQCRISVAPLRFGAGMKGKIGEALSYGLPVVTTTIGAEGMGLTDGVDARIADDPDAFASAVVELYGDATQWRSLADAGRRRVEADLSEARLRTRLDAFLTTAVDRRRRAGRAIRLAP
jgi:GT2 family glycosyltransferase/voltage-gated potassium channel Kch